MYDSTRGIVHAGRLAKAGFEKQLTALLLQGGAKKTSSRLAASGVGLRVGCHSLSACTVTSPVASLPWGVSMPFRGDSMHVLLRCLAAHNRVPSGVFGDPQIMFLLEYLATHNPVHSGVFGHQQFLFLLRWLATHPPVPSVVVGDPQILFPLGCLATLFPFPLRTPAF